MTEREQIPAPLPKRLHITDSGRADLARAVAIDWDWALPASSFDKLAEALGGLSYGDLEAAYMLAYHLKDTINTLLIRRDMQRSEAGEPDA